MKKVFIVLLLVILNLNSTFADDSSYDKKIKLISEKVEKIVAKKGEKSRANFIDILGKYREKTKGTTNTLIRDIIRELYKNTKTIYMDNMDCNIGDYIKVSEDKLNGSKIYDDSKVIGLHFDCNVKGEGINLKNEFLVSIADRGDDLSKTVVYFNADGAPEGVRFFQNDSILKSFNYGEYKAGDNFDGYLLVEMPNDMINFNLTLANIESDGNITVGSYGKLFMNVDKNKVILSTKDRPIGTIEYTDTRYRTFSESNKMYEIITTNNIVKGYEIHKNLKTGKIDSYNNKVDKGNYNSQTGEISLAYHYYKYPNIREGLTTIKNSFLIKDDNTVFDMYGNEVGIFHPNQLHNLKKSDIASTQGCTDLWGKNKIYYDKTSEFFDEISDKYSYNYTIEFFCSKEDAENKGYKISADASSNLDDIDRSSSTDSSSSTSQSYSTSSSRNYYTGPRGGCYYYNSSGNKSYVSSSYCN